MGTTIMSGLFQDYNLDAAAVAASNMPEVMSKELPPDDLATDSHNDTATSLSLDLGREVGLSSAGDSGSNSASAENDHGKQQNSIDTSPLETLEAPRLPLSTPMSMADNATGNPNVGNGSGIDPSLLNNNLFIDTFGLSPSNEELSGTEPYSQPSFNSLLDDYVSTEMLLNNNQGPTQETITSPVPGMAGSRGSISHSVDFWNLPNNPSKSRRRTTGFTGIDSELSDVLNGYHLNLRRNSLSNNVSGPPPPSQRHGIKKQPQRSSMSVLDGSLNTDLFNKIYENGVSSSNLKLVSPFDKNTDGDNEQSLHSLPNLEPMVSPKSPKTVIGTGTGNGTSGSQKPAATNRNFINPSMVLSDNASASAKVATTGGGDNEACFDLSLNPQAIMRESPNPGQGELGVPSPLVLPQELSSPSPKAQEITTREQQDPLSFSVPQTPLPLAVPQQSQPQSQPPLQAQAQPDVQSHGQPQPQTQQQRQLHHYSQQVPAPATAKRRMSTANVMAIQNGSSGVNVQNQPAVSSRNNSRSITPMNTSDEDAKPFKCKECSKAFRRSEHLKRHIRSVHSSERPFACMFCEKKFSRSDNLSQHLKTHKKHGDF